MSRLPLALAPLEEESWHSYLTRRAAQHGTTVAALMKYLDLRSPRGHWPGHYGVILKESDTQRVATQLGITCEQVHRMHLSRYDQQAFDLEGLSRFRGIAATRATSHAAWIWLSGSTYCPTCLASDGAWRLAWRIPWLTACRTHATNLAGTCPACHAVPGIGNQFHTSAPTRITTAPDVRACTHPTEGGEVCGADLTTSPVTSSSPDRLRRVSSFTELTEGRPGMVAGRPHTSLQTLRAWQATMGLAVRLEAVDSQGWGRTHRWANPPRDPDVIDRLLSAAEPMVTAPSPEKAADILEQWCHRSGIRSPHADTFKRMTQPSAALQPVIDELLNRYGRAHTVIQRQLTDSAGKTIWPRDWTIDDVPQLVWPCALPEYMRHSTRPDQRILRAVVAMILVRMCADSPTWVASGKLLGFPPDKARNWTRHAFAAKWGLKQDLLAAAKTTATNLQKQSSLHGWRDRPPVMGHGLSALREAQQPKCVAGGVRGTCPCKPRG